MPRHTGRRLNSKARRRQKEVGDLKKENAMLKGVNASLDNMMKQQVRTLTSEIAELKDRSFTGGKDGALVLRKHYERQRPGRMMYLTVMLDVERLKEDLYRIPTHFTDGRHIAYILSREIEVALVKLVEEEVLYLRGNTNGK